MKFLIEVFVRKTIVKYIKKQKICQHSLVLKEDTYDYNRKYLIKDREKTRSFDREHIERVQYDCSKETIKLN